MHRWIFILNLFSILYFEKLIVKRSKIIGFHKITDELLRAINAHLVIICIITSNYLKITMALISIYIKSQ
jgi:hypothetical protein